MDRPTFFEREGPIVWVQRLCLKGGWIMSDRGKNKPPKRQYPPFYEKFVPIALGVMVVIIIILLIIAVAVALGLFPVA